MEWPFRSGQTSFLPRGNLSVPHKNTRIFIHVCAYYHMPPLWGLPFSGMRTCGGLVVSGLHTMQMKPPTRVNWSHRLHIGGYASITLDYTTPHSHDILLNHDHVWVETILNSGLYFAKHREVPTLQGILSRQ